MLREAEMINRNAFLKTGLVLTAIVWLSAAAFGQPATAREEKVTMKTYPFSDPDPMPLIGPIYPYFRYQGFSHTGRNQEWKMVALENPYVKVLVAPEIGGKVWGAVEKSAGREFIYWNKAVKFRQIALRGPWTSGGIEFNFGIIGHAPTVATPVDYLIRDNPDESASCIIGAIDLPSRTCWRVNIRVPKDAAYLETECFWFNPTTLHDSLYHWMTGAEDVANDLKFYYPGTHKIGHGGQVSSWPVEDNGQDVSYYRNNNFGSHKSYHILGEYGEFFGGYFEDSGYGYGHWALRDDKPGMKLWLWSLGRDGEIWTDLLSEGKKYNYAEPQTGLLYNQAGGNSSLTPFKHADFAPQSVLRWKEIWFPVKDIGGLVAASPYAALNVTRDKGDLCLGLCPLQKIDDDLIVKVGNQEIFRKRLTLGPLETFGQEIDISGREGEVAVELGGEKLRWSSSDKERNKLGRPIVAPNDFDWTSAEGLCVAGEELARQRSYAEALVKFQACLEKEPGHVRALARAAELCFKRGEPERALEYARRALAIDTYDPGANFIYGVINRSVGRLADAKDGFGWAARSLEFRSAAYEQLAEISLVENNPSRAAEYCRWALDYNRY
jgi:tetratricopeptide (TPR) repeat protein